MFQCFWISGIEHKQCDQKFSQKSFLKAHLKCHHAGDRVCACPYCGTFLANTTKLSDHVHRRQPTNDTPLICVLCQKKFSTSRLLKIHCRKHVKSVKCAYCDVVMDCASAVSKHMKIVHARIRTEKCPNCDQTFGLKTDLQKHIYAIHKTEPQFSCRYCDKKFRWEKQLRGHEKTHSDDYTPTPYLCHKCPMKYKNGSSLSRHFISQHNLPLPAGFNRFQYKKCHDGFYRLQTSRCISKNVVEALPFMIISLKTFERLKSIRTFSTSSVRRILSQEFQLNNEWQNRHIALKELNLGGDYEWIAAVHKKFVGGGKASAVDVDAATCLSEESDQLEDILELVYKLRHTENAADLLPSTEYALYRLFLKHNAHEELFKVLNDPINYGVFPNYHVSALLLSHYIKAKNYPTAAKIASILFQQEMFDNKFLNLIAFYSLIKFCELPAEERIFDEIIQKRIVTIDEDDINEDDLRTMKFPFLKNRYFDEHFDLVETNALVGKSLEWFGRELQSSMDQGIVFNVQILACLLRENYAELEKLLSVGVELSSSVVSAVRGHLEGLISKLPEESREENEQFKLFSACIAKLEASPISEKPISDIIFTKIEELQREGEKELMEEQRVLFKNWGQERKEFVRLQAERVNLKLKIEEIKAEIQKKHEEKEKLFFFENRVNWEDRAAEKDKLFEEFNLDKKDESITESEYAKTMFEKALKPIQRVSNS
uniref:C2H2-type domain-containing protein n=1 Tax=Panagrolaimus davidi TaxID=227884 RepID=A0A914QBA2_9BILA